MNCPNCGGSIPDTASFCPLCGSSVDVNAASSASNQDSYSQAGSYEQPQSYNQPNYGGYNDPYAGGQPGGQRPMGGRFKSRNLALCIVFSIITCGIYGLYWMYKLNDEVNDLADVPNGTSGGMVILFSIITCGIYTWYWLYKMGERVGTIKNKMGRQAGSDSILFLILAIFGLGIISYALIQDTINNAVEGNN